MLRTLTCSNIQTHNNIKLPMFDTKAYDSLPIHWSVMHTCDHYSGPI